MYVVLKAHMISWCGIRIIEQAADIPINVNLCGYNKIQNSNFATCHPADAYQYIL